MGVCKPFLALLWLISLVYVHSQPSLKKRETKAQFLKVHSHPDHPPEEEDMEMVLKLS